jgi:formate-dependent nitrite reductase membrane component NrfD
VVAAVLSLLQNQEAHRLLHVASPLLALVFTGLTVFFLVFDLKRPARFHYLFCKPNWRSWLVIGGYILIAYSLFAFLWAVYGFFGECPPPWLIWPSAVLALGAAGYSAFLFAQAKGRDLWQSPVFLWQLLVQAIIAGSATAILTDSLFGLSAGLSGLLGRILAGSLILSLGMLLGEIFLPHVSEDVKRAVHLLKRGRLSRRFWGLVIGTGIVLPLLLIALSGDAHFLRVLASALALVGLWVFEDLWVTAGQAVPLS